MLELNFSPFPEITTGRLHLRQVTDDDAEQMFYLRSSSQLMKYICRPRPDNVNEIRPFIQKIRDMIAANEGVAWAMTLKGEDRLIGHISFHIVIKEHHRAEVGYILHDDYHGTGIMAEALQAVLHFGFTKMGLHSVFAITSPENIASRKLLERNGFAQEGYFREDFFWEGSYQDSVIYGLIGPAKK